MCQILISQNGINLIKGNRIYKQLTMKLLALNVDKIAFSIKRNIISLTNAHLALVYIILAFETVKGMKVHKVLYNVNVFVLHATNILRNNCSHHY